MRREKDDLVFRRVVGGPEISDFGRNYYFVLLLVRDEIMSPREFVCHAPYSLLLIVEEVDLL